ncbi:DegQ family serine endoprotease [Parathalassolituus penaei]|uniref:Probable periplasmic serine endoprotease DegP-like n=1 Tax=Parathalassolituus penaei TaxID=2997323 RepID=A0A9X3EE63_9GAMM|nr:DegQ family serine endoprotease [Parathalassolituus penaei]MCY0965943.1 DegQ family serine endoprotease [Parathalassolituus penaei]
MTKLIRWVLPLFLLVGSAVQAASLPDFRDLVKDASPAVVNISTVQHVNNNVSSRYQQPDGLPEDMPEIFRHFFGGQGGQMPSPYGGSEDKASLGSGFIVSKDGYILTNNHVIKDADEIVVRLNDRRELEATVIGADESTDLAVLKVDAKDLPTVKLGDSDALEVGEWVVAIGSPFGFDYSVTAGIVSAKGRSLPNENYVPFIQTDVAINPGNSGGPLFNLDGKVVGINSQIYTRSGGFMGVSFAIPINVAMDVAEQLKASGKVSRGWLGVVIQEVNKDLAESFGLDKAAGALVAQVVPGSPAEKAGIRNGDIITRFNGQDVTMSSDLPHLVGRVKPNDKATIDLVRNGKRKQVEVVIGTLANDKDVASQNAHAPDANVKRNDRMGVEVTSLTAEQAKQLGSGGVLVRDVTDGPAAQAGLMSGDVITMVNGESINDANDFGTVVAAIPSGRNVPMRVVRRGSALFVAIRLP